MKFVLASHNRGKLKEMQEILSRLGVEVVLESDLGLADVYKRQTLDSSSAASISSMTQNGVGCTFRMAKYRAMATKAFSPPDSSVMVFSCFPGGCTRISMPQLRISFSSSSSS